MRPRAWDRAATLERMTDTRANLQVRPSPIPLILRADASTVDRAIRRSELARVVRGVYAEATGWARLRAWERYLARVHAVALLRPGAVFAGESAAAAWGMPILSAQAEVHVLSNDCRLSRESGGIRTHATDDSRDVRASGGLLLLAPDEAAVDIARARHPGVGLMAADGALRLMPGRSAADLLAVNESRSSTRGRARAEWSLSRATPLGETALESVSRAIIEWLGSPEPVLQQPFTGPAGEKWRTDAFWPEERVIGEADGAVKYDGTHGDGREALVDEKRREDELRRRVNGFARWMWPQAETYLDLRDVLRAAGLREARSLREAQLASLRTVLAAARRAAGRESAALREGAA